MSSSEYEGKRVPPSASQDRPAGLRVLVVEDHRDTADSMVIWLETLGHQVALARSGPEAVQAAQDHQPDVVLLDIGLPGMDGYSVARRIREIRVEKRMLVVATTGYGRDEDRRKAGESGIDVHLLKPVDLRHLAELLAGFQAFLGR